MLISELDGTQPRFLAKGVDGTRQGEMGLRGMLPALAAARSPGPSVDLAAITDASNAEVEGSLLLNGLTTPGTENLKLKGIGMVSMRS